MEARAKALEERFGARVRLLELPEVREISSTQIREQLARGDEAAAESLPEPVYGYILRHGLYGTHADLKRLSDRDLRACSYSMIRAKRIKHVKGTE